MGPKLLEKSNPPSRHHRLIQILVAAFAILGSSLVCNIPPLHQREPEYISTFTARLTIETTQVMGSPTPPPIQTIQPMPTPEAQTPGNPTVAVPPVFLEDPPRGKIVFTCYIDGFDNICIMDADGSNIQRLTEAKATEFYASLSPDGTGIVFSSRRDGSFQIFSMQTDGGNLLRLSDIPGNLYAPEISPDGSHIVFTVEAVRSQIWVMDRAGANPHPLTDTGSNIDPTWSPDGSQIAFASVRSGSQQLWVMNSDGTSPRQVTDMADMGGRSSWSADGSSLAFYAGPRGDRNIYTINLNGTGLRKLTQGGDNLGPSYAPDGAWIAFASFRDGNNEIYIMRPDGSEQSRLTTTSRPDWQPRWGP
jgi:Tol biopolymer transport system component